MATRGETPPALALPEQVRRALDEARRRAFDRSCSLETVRLLHTLAAGRPGGRFAELGSGTGVGAAWLLAGMDAGARLVTAELDPERASITRAVLAEEERGEVLHAHWTAALSRGPFDLIFSDCAPAKRETESLGVLIDALAPGGMLVLDNFSPPARLPESLYAGDPEREALWAHPDLLCTELQVSAGEQVILAVGWA